MLDLLPVTFHPNVGPPVKIPLYKDNLELLHITGWSDLDERFIFAFATKSVPPTCDFRLKRVALEGVGWLFGEEDDWGWKEHQRDEEEWAAVVAKERDRKRIAEGGMHGEGTGWSWLWGRKKYTL